MMAIYVLTISFLWVNVWNRLGEAFMQWLAIFLIPSGMEGDRLESYA
ncbi:MAG: hypothetical protein AAGA75_25495 [Cyanobacteria bacterium P01_E01_bin.6]